MGLEIGSIIEGKVTGIAKFGAFVELPDKKVGLVHISEVSSDYVNNVGDYLKVHDTVKVKVISIDDKGKIALSIKQAEAGEKKPLHSHEGARGERKDFHHEGNAHHEERRPFVKRETGRFGGFESRAPKKRETNGSFEDKLSRFLKDSDERLLDLKRNVESKRGGRGARRAD